VTQTFDLRRICTVANYEYAIYYNFYQDGTLECEIKLTGILNIYTMAEGEDAGKFGTEVAPRIMAHHHQVRCQTKCASLDGCLILAFCSICSRRVLIL
jgi:Cu2+-containing amine oxidase